MAVGLGLILLLLRLDNRFRTVSQVEEETGHAVLAAVPVLSEKRLAAAERSSRQGKGKGEHADVGEGADYSARWSPDIVFRPGLQSSLYAESSPRSGLPPQNSLQDRGRESTRMLERVPTTPPVGRLTLSSTPVCSPLSMPRATGFSGPR